MGELVLSVEIDRPQQEVWDAIVDWDSHGSWIPLTRVHSTAHGGVGVGAGFDTWSGVGRFGFHDPMTIVVWEPPHRVVVRKTGRVIRGAAGFEVVALADDRTRLTMSEWIDPPLGILGRVGFRVASPLLRRGGEAILRRFRRTLSRTGSRIPRA